MTDMGTSDADQLKSCYVGLRQRVTIMKHVTLAEARNRMDELFDEVERGGVLMVSKDGDPTLRDGYVISDERRERARLAMERIVEARKTAPRVAVEEILAWRDEGRKY